VTKKPDYNAGGTLKFILPFLKAYGATNDNIKSFSQENVLLIPSALDTLQYIYNLLPSFIVSTSYQQYIHALCDSTGFPYENTYSTQLNIDKYTLSSKEKIRLMEIRREIIDNPDLENLDKIFWKELPKMRIGRIIEDVNPIGGEGKKKALKDIISKFQFNASDLVYVGDSITDIQPLKFAHESDGLAISFNGNEYAVKESEIVIMADNTLMISIITDLFNKAGKNGVLEFINTFIDDPQLALYNYPIDPQLTLKFPSMSNSKIGIVNSDNLDEL
jgi:energy-converting hydrogenase A subunit R